MRLATVLVLFLALPASAQIVVNSTNDVLGDEGNCTLREALRAANTDTASGATPGECAAGSGADAIVISVAPGSTIALQEDLPAVTESISLEGPTGLADGVTIDGRGQHRIFELDSNGLQQTHTLRGLTITRGMASAGGGILVGFQDDCVFENLAVVRNVAENAGGGIFTGPEGMCEMNRVNVSDNEVQNFAGGGGIRLGNSGSATIRNSTIANNRALQSGGGGILVGFFALPEATFVLEQSTVSGNSAAGGGGGIAQVGSNGTSIIRASTIVGNSITGTASAGGGVSFSAPLTMESTIVAGNTAERGSGEWNDLSLGNNNTTSNGGNVIGINGFFDDEFPLGEPNAGGDKVGNEAMPLDALLAGLRDNGGPMRTHLPRANSPVLDAGVCPGFPADQRGSIREVDETNISDRNGDACDSGAVEGRTFVVGTERDPIAGIALDAPVPNPMRGGAQVVYALDTPQVVRLSLVDARGRELAVLIEGAQAAGEHGVALPSGLAPGVYLLRLGTEAGAVTQRVTVVR
ncbi:MAG: choice-of-anchor Q domain-containing protein [Bacteroidota bacterium]